MPSPPSLNLVVIRSSDLDRAQHFYEALGLSFERHSHGKGPEHLAAELGPDGFVFEIYPANDKVGDTKGTRIGFRVGSIDNLINDLVTAGGKIAQDPHDSEWGRRAVVIDPDGHKVELLSSTANHKV